MTERILITVDVPYDDLEELNDGCENGDPVSQYIHRANIHTVETALKEINLLKPGDQYRISFIGSEDVFTSDIERTIKVNLPVYDKGGRQVDTENHYVHLEIQMGNKN